ncbi:uncharacterized protein BDR25DRAFT_336943 [Lindgomyces ingoldianus]|uniref:Uncharacterized protein n=1 Tax=Lindgomyces ingoldianus TaxID=673940 RepID=A0ACB6QF83_9PLEO|nr:uncharacterized protein BDR25DRAFT_336943 [Lindgomyces ingoldianus]KAF2465525.1 hypothetical protein BDR25DRAFT_336943 [Lindgomyces ingoldianus]
MPPAGASRTVAAAPTSDRRQSTRQGRTSVTRPTNYYARPFAGRLAAMGSLEQTPPVSNSTPGFLPALTHFTQAVDAFPKELIKHFAMLKEVEAKIYDPENVLQLLLAEIARQPIPTMGERSAVAYNQIGGDNAINGSANGSQAQDAPTRHQLPMELFPADPNNLPPEELAGLKKRQLFFRLRMVIASMLPALDEKLVVLNSAKTTKDKGLARMNSSYPHLDSEISEEARYGSLNHWAYADKEEKKKGGASHERHRREVVSANNLAAAAQIVHDADSIAAKSEARREAMLANKRNRNQHIDSDFDDRPVTKKTQKRKAVAADTAAAASAATAAAADSRGIGLGITSNGATQQGKRKKTEKALAAAAPAMDRSLSSALQAAGPASRGGTSPRATPGTENGGKRKPRAAPGPPQGRKRALPAYSPPLASSPLAPNFKITAAATERPVSSRARKNSTANSVASAPQEPSLARRPSSSHSNLQLASSDVMTELEQAAGIIQENLSVKGDSTPKEPPDALAPMESSNLKHEEVEPQEGEGMEIDVPAPAPVTTRVGRTSKTATPVVGTFPDVPMVRSRSTRNASNGNGGGSNSHASSENNSTTTGAVSKRGHKKNAASITTAVVSSPALKPTKDPKSGPPSSSGESVAPEPEFSDGVDEDGDEPRYCYCNEVSYGNMVACDNDTCPREWFHLACVNMEKPPNSRTKWFCSDECKEAQQARGKGAKGGRPGSSRQ